MAERFAINEYEFIQREANCPPLGVQAAFQLNIEYFGEQNGCNYSKNGR